MHNGDVRGGGESTVMAALRLFPSSCTMMDGMSRLYQEETY